MRKFILIVIVFASMVIYHYRTLWVAHKEAALDILDALRLAELEVKPDTMDEKTGIMYFSPPKYAKRLAIMDCEQLVYERYRLWE